MSKTNLLSIMENKLSNPPFPGYNASYDGDCSKFLFNKLLGDEVHSNGFTDISLLSELSESTVHHYEEITSPAVPTYTLDDLIDLAADVSENDHENAFNILFDTEDLSELPTDVPSPLSSISDDSCDLQVLLNNFNSSFQDTLANYDTSNNLIDESLDSESIDIDETGTLFEATICNTSQDCAAEYLSDLTNKNTVRFADLYSLLQNQITSITNDSQGDDNLKDTSSSESGDDDQRYSPYKKPKKSRTPEQKVRKKTQNRNAAEKYRSKKKDELKSMNEEASKLERTNKELKSKVQGLHTEIGYLKNLMLDVIKARLSKGTISVHS